MPTPKINPEEKAIKKPRGDGHKYSPTIDNNGLNLEPGDNSKYCQIILDIMQWPTPNRNNIEELEQRLVEYIAYCNANDLKVGNQGVYFALGIDKTTAHDWENGHVRTPAHSDFIKKVKKICAFYRENLMQNGKINPVTGIFWQKNYDGFVDQQNFIVTPNSPLGEITDKQELASKYLLAAAEN